MSPLRSYNSIRVHIFLVQALKNSYKMYIVQLVLWKSPFNAFLHSASEKNEV